MNFHTGLGRGTITCFIPGLGMMGYGQPHNVIKEIGTPLLARALALTDEAGNTLLLVHLELAFASMALKEELLRRIQLLHPDWKITEENLLLTATHTHSGPGGFGHYPLYNFTVPGFQTRVVDTVVKGALHAAEEAMGTLAPAQLSFGEIRIPEDKEVAFNRSLPAHLNNPEAAEDEGRARAVDRRMRGLLIKSPEGKLRAIVNWFGVHCTSVSSYNQKIHHDNKGVAAELFEKHYPGTLALFLQSAAGDVSPNFVWDTRIKRMRGKFEDQYESAAFNGEIQFRESEKIQSTEIVSGAIETRHAFFDMRSVATAPAHGVAFFKGTLEGPGMPPELAPGLMALTKLVRKSRLIRDPQKHQEFYDHQDPKAVMLDHRDGSFLGVTVEFVKKLPKIPDPILEAFRKAARHDSLKTLPWVPAIVPFQLIRLGQLLFVTVPGEITTMAARRLELRVLSETKDLGITQVIITSYANGYMGYVTTPEEYAVQCYEGGHTVYGRKTLEAITTATLGLVQELKGRTCPYEKLPCFHFPSDELARRTV